MERINKHTVLKIIREKGKWEGYISPSNVNSYHIIGGWHLGHKILIKKNEQDYYVESNDQTMELNSYLRNFQIYNCCSELGQRVVFWQ